MMSGSLEIAQEVWTFLHLLAIAELLTLAGLFMVLVLSHALKLARWGLEEYDEFRRWWEEFKRRRR